MRRITSRGSSSSLFPRSLAVRPSNLLPAAALFAILFFFFLERQSRLLQIQEVDDGSNGATVKGLPPAGMLLKSETRLNLEKLAKQQAELAHETITLAKEAERLAQRLTTKPQPVVSERVSHEGVPREVVHRQTPASVRERPESRPREASVMPKPAVLPKPMSEARPLPDDLTGWVKRPADMARRDAVKGAMQHAWSSYEKYAWGSDELCPKTQRGKNLFAGLGATIIDSLDTLYIMGMHAEFQRARDWVATELTFDKHFEASVFETIIRIVGGFMSAYDLSGDNMFVSKCEQLVTHLAPAFNTPTGVPYNIINLRTGHAKNPSWTAQASTLAEFGTQQLEFVALSHATGDSKYAEMSEHIIKFITDPEKARNKKVPVGGEGLFPLFLSPLNGMWTSPKISFGAMGDSFFEYLIKMWVQGGKTQALQKYRDLFDGAMRGMINVLVQRSSSGLAYVAEWDRAGLVHKMDHLACFVPGMLALGAEGPHEREYMELAKELMYTCVQMYFRQPSGVSPEFVWFRPAEDMVSGAHHNLLRPETVESLMILYRKTGDDTYREWGWQIFQAFEMHCRVPNGYVGLMDVRVAKPQKDDTMQSFFLAETLKYLYLLFDDTGHIAMDEWVFNTEAHPIRIVERTSSFIN